MVDATVLSCYKDDTAGEQTVEPQHGVQSRSRFSIRAYSPADLDQLVQLCKQQAASSDYSTVTFNSAKLREYISYIATQDDYCIVCAFDGTQKLIGFSAYTVTSYMFSYEKLITDLSSFVVPEWRKSTVYPRLMQHIEAWGKKQGAKQMCSAISTGVQIEAMHEMFLRNGYRHLGGVYKKVL
jgi:GNAT superfamily N-acetyltransferase